MKEFVGKLRAETEARLAERKRNILSQDSLPEIRGKRNFYVSADGNDGDSGTSPEAAWKTPERVSRADLMPGDAVLFRRGDIFRGQIVCRPGVTYAYFGKGERPRIYGGPKDLADESLWELFDSGHHIYRLKEKMQDAGTLVFNGGEKHSRKLIPSYIDGRFVRRDDPQTDFSIAEDMTTDLDLFCACDSVLTDRPSHGETWPVPDACPENTGDLYLRCDAGNPGRVFASIEALPGRHAFVVRDCDNVTICGLCIRYWGAHGISAGGKCVKGLHVSRCEIGWIGGTIQHYFGTDPNYPEGTRGTVTRYGNGIEIYGGCEDYECSDNYIYEVYDAGVTHQFTVTGGEPCRMEKVRYTGNFIENCTYSIEYFLSGTEGTAGLMKEIYIGGNILSMAGYGWGRQRHNTWTPAHIKSWNVDNPADDFRIEDNVFFFSKYRLLHLCCRKAESRPRTDGNRYFQTYGRSLGQFGAYENGMPPILSFFETSEDDVLNSVGDRHAEIYYLKED